MSYRKNKADLINNIEKRELNDRIREIVNVPFNAWDYKVKIYDVDPNNECLFCGFPIASAAVDCKQGWMHPACVDEAAELSKLNSAPIKKPSLFVKAYAAGKNFFLSSCVALYVRVKSMTTSVE